MAQMYGDYRWQECYNDGVKDAIEEFFPNDPTDEDRAWWDEYRNVDSEIYVREEDQRQREREQQLRDELADSLDHFWNGPR